MDSLSSTAPQMRMAFPVPPPRTLSASLNLPSASLDPTPTGLPLNSPGSTNDLLTGPLNPASHLSPSGNLLAHSPKLIWSFSPSPSSDPLPPPSGQPTLSPLFVDTHSPPTLSLYHTDLAFWLLKSIFPITALVRNVRVKHPDLCPSTAGSC